jgi:two-component SAPR family response regulator
VIFISGYSRARDQRTANLPQASYLQKPYSPTHLGRLVREVLDAPAAQKVSDNGQTENSAIAGSPV